MLRQRSINLNETPKSQVYFRITPTTIKHQSPPPPQSPQTYLLYLQKGMQILGKTVQFSIPSPNGQYNFDAASHKFDFQIVSDRNLNYTWGLYSVDQEAMQERVFGEVFCIKEWYGKYEKECARDGYDLEVNLKYFCLGFKLYIQNTPIFDHSIGSALQTCSEDGKAGVGKRSDTKNKNKQRMSMITTQKQKQRTSLTIASEIPRPTSQILPKTTPQPKSEKQQQSSQNDQNQNKKTESKGPILLPNLPRLDQIEEEKQREEILTPIGHGLKGESFDQVVSSMNQNKFVDGGETVQAKFETYQPKDDEEGIQVAANSPENNTENVGNSQNEQSAHSLQNQNDPQTKQPKIETFTPNNSSLKLKKILIVVLLLALAGGIVGALLSSSETQSIEQPSQTHTQIPTPKPKKKSKKPKQKP